MSEKWDEIAPRKGFDLNAAFLPHYENSLRELKKSMDAGESKNHPADAGHQGIVGPCLMEFLFLDRAQEILEQLEEQKGEIFRDFFTSGEGESVQDHAITSRDFEALYGPLHEERVDALRKQVLEGLKDGTPADMSTQLQDPEPDEVYYSPGWDFYQGLEESSQIGLYFDNLHAWENAIWVEVLDLSKFKLELENLKR
jgi:hypothetical protein